MKPLYTNKQRTLIIFIWSFAHYGTSPNTFSLLLQFSGFSNSFSLLTLLNILLTLIEGASSIDILFYSGVFIGV